MKKFLSRYASTIHKWLGLAIGIQVVLWIAGGVVMSWFEIERVRGEHNITPEPPAPFVSAETLVPVSEVLAAAGEFPVIEVRLKRLLGEPVYELRGVEEHQVALYDAAYGHLLSPLDAETVRKLALADFSGEADPSQPQWLEAHNLEYRAQLPVWRVALNDAEDTRLYLSPLTGEVTARRNATWRLYDFFWMLHIMDYENRTDFNHPLLIWASVFAFVLAVTGIVLLFFRMTKKDFRWLRKRS